MYKKEQFEKWVKNHLEIDRNYTKKELVGKIESHFPAWSPATINARISALKKEGILKSPARGMYSKSLKKNYVPGISARLKKIYRILHEHFPYANYCVWDSRWMNEFMRHQPVHYYLVAEVEKEALHAAFNILVDSYSRTFLDPDPGLYELYVSNTDEPLLLIPLVSESPVQTLEKIEVPRIEKLLVDMLIEKDLFGAQQSEIEFIFQMVVEKYSVNFSMMRRYASRRNRSQELQELICVTSAKND